MIIIYRTVSELEVKELRATKVEAFMVSEACYSIIKQIKFLIGMLKDRQVYSDTVEKMRAITPPLGRAELDNEIAACFSSNTKRM